MNRIRILFAACLAPVLLLSGCALFAPTPPELDFTTKLAPKWTAKAELVGELALAGDAVLSYYLEDDALRVGSWSLKTGDMLWSDAAAVSAQNTSWQLSATVGQNEDGQYMVAYARNAEDKWPATVVNLVLADALTGTLKTLGSPDNSRMRELVARVDSHVTSCSGLPGVCFIGAVLRMSGQEWLRLDFEERRIDLAQIPGMPDGGSMEGEGLFTTSEGEGEAEVHSVHRILDGKEIWQRSLNDLFDRPTRQAGSWHLFETGEGKQAKTTVLGRVAFEDSFHVTEGGRNVHDPTGQAVVALDGETGKKLWVLDGADDFCTAAGVEKSLVEETFPVCHYSDGEISWNDEPTGFSFTGQAELLGLDIRTGAVRWERDLGSNVDNVASRDFQKALSSERAWRVLFDGSKPQLVNALAGESAALATDARVLCSSEQKWTHQPRKAEEAGNYFIGTRKYPCTVDRKASPKDIASPGALRMEARDAGNGLWLLSSPDGILAYDSPEPGALQSSSPIPTPSPTAIATAPAG